MALTAEERAQVERLTRVARGEADHEYFDDRADEPPLNAYVEELSAADRAYLDRMVKMAADPEAQRKYIDAAKAQQ